MSQSLVDFSKFGAPTGKQRETEAGISQAQASTRKTERETEKLDVTLPAVKEKADADAAVATYNANNLGFEKANEEFQKQYVVWRSGEASEFFDNIKQLSQAVRVLRSGKQITGAMYNRLPELIRNAVNPNSTNIRGDVEKVIQSSLRTTLGAQFTQVEGDRFLARVFNPDLPESMNADNVEAELNKIRDIAAGREAMARYYEENGTLKGYRPDEWRPLVEKEFNVMQGVPPAEREAAAVENYREAMNNIGGDPLRGWRLRPNEEQQIVAYANSPDFTEKGFVDLVASLTEQATGRPADRARLAEEARTIGMRPVGARIGGVDYTSVDAEAARNAGLSDVAIQALKNIPESGVQLVSSLLSPVSDALRSAVLGERVGVYKTLPDLVADVAAKAGIGDTDQATLDALSAALSDRYGSLAGFKQAVAKDPLGVVGDASVILTMGGAAAARVPGRVGAVGRAAEKAGAAIDPLSFAGSMAARTMPDNLAARTGNVAAEGASLSTGAPASAFRQAFERGAGRQRIGVNPISESFREGISGAVDPAELVSNAKQAMGDIRDAASQDYRSGMVDISADKTVLSFDELDKTLAQMRADTMYKGEVVKPEALATVDSLQKVVDQWKALDPAEFHTPEGFDKLKQRLFEETENIPFDDRVRRRVAGAVYGATKNTIASQAPAYAKVMDQYADVQDVLKRMESELGLGQAPVDTAATKITQRPPSRKGRDDLVSLLAEYDPKLGAQVAGEQLSSMMPRGLRGVGAGLGVTLGSIGNIATLGTLSPRLMGEAAYGLGRASVPVGQGIDFLQQNPAGVLAAQRGLALTEATEAERERQELMDRYGFSLPAPTEGVAPVERPITVLGEEPASARGINLGGFEPTYENVEPEAAPVQTTQIIDGRVTDIDQVTGQRVFLDTGEPVERMKRGGAVKGYNRGGTALRDRARSVGQGVTFGFGDEIEGGIRALGSALREGDLSSLRQKYLQERDMVRAQQKAYEDARPVESLLYEGGGAMLTGLIPGAQGATAARMAQLAARSPKLARAAGVAADTALYGAGTAESVRDIPRSIRDEALFAVPMYGAAEGVRSGVNRYRVRKGKKR
jgi:hypothetical protein